MNEAPKSDSSTEQSEPGAKQELVKLKPRHKAKSHPKRVIAGLLAGSSLQQAALDAGYSPNTAHQHVELLKTLRNRYGPEFADRFPPEVMVRLTEEGLAATHVEPFLDVKAGIIRYSEPLADYQTRLKYLELISRILGLLTSRTEVTGPGGGPIELATRIQIARERLSKAQDVVVEAIHNQAEGASPLESA